MTQVDWTEVWFLTIVLGLLVLGIALLYVLLWEIARQIYNEILRQIELEKNKREKERYTPQNERKRRKKMPRL